MEREAGKRRALEIRHAAAGQRQLCVDAAHDPPPRAKRLDGAAVGERLNEFQHQQ